MKRNPEFVLYTGSMFSGKTSRLLADIDRCSYQKRRVIAFKPKMDDRYSRTDIVTHGGSRADARSISTGADIIDVLATCFDDFDVIAVDEAFMIDGVSDVLISLFQQGKDVLVSSLDMSASCNPFHEVVKMYPWATRAEKCAAVCSICQSDAYYTHRKFESNSEIQVGGNDLYEPRCWEHHEAVNLRDSV